MNVFFIDTSLSKLTVSVLNSKEVLAIGSYSTNNKHSEYIMVEVYNVFNISGLKPNDIDKIMVVNGPGSFTGIRIGVTIAKVYAWCLNKMVIPISSLKAIAISVKEEANYYVSVIDAKRENVYAGIYDKNYNIVMEEKFISISKLNETIKDLSGKIIITGDVQINNNYETIPIDLNVLRIVNFYKNEIGIKPHQLNPKYLKKVEAEEKKD